MPKFRYTALNADGRQVSGQLEAEGEGAAVRILGERQLFPVNIASADASQSKRRRVSSRDIGMMYGQLADLIGSGVPMLRALDSLIRSTVNSQLKAILKEVRTAVADGQTLTDALRKFPEVFPPLHTSMVQAGERASFLEDVLRSLSEFLERLDELRAKVMGAMIYPALLSALGATVMAGALIFFVPKFEPLLAGAQKPLPTVLLFGASTILRSYWYIVALVLAGLIGALVSALSKESSRRTLEIWQHRVPVVGTALKMLAITRFCRILGTMLANGVPMLGALKIAKDATGSRLLGEKIAIAAESIRDGKSLSGPLSQGGLFPDQIMAMITVAEESNKLDKVLLQIANTVERRTNQQVDQSVRLIEPVILCLVAAGIGFLALGLLLPIFTLAGSLGKH
ncbi:MAG: type II secretion system F family protein [Verrucomicrobia bacterium]|jgi:general secretion pathway protein F/type IV pilus assembly protein PilC|nr:type II secretion system F family protein [Verrucomicrobiota bacterium]